MNVNEFKKAYTDKALDLYARHYENCTDGEKYEILVNVIKDCIKPIRAESAQNRDRNQEKRIYYFSMEFLIGKLCENYLINLGLRDVAEKALSELGLDINKIFEFEADPGLGNGGLGRLAACFIDSMAALSVPGTGIGLRFRFGLFRQRIDNGYQIEDPDDWLSNGFPWESCKEDEAVEVHFGGVIDRKFENGRLSFVHRDYKTILAVPYDVPVAGYNGVYANHLRLWAARPSHETIDMDAFNHGDYARALRDRSETEAITYVLYPNDNQETGKLLRLKQEYLMVCAGIEYILRSCKANYGEKGIHELYKHVSIHTNDTHPALCIPELMRKLVDEEGFEWDEAWDITTKTISFTNHTVMPEALEKWPQYMLQSLLPRIYMIIEEIDRRWKEGLSRYDSDSSLRELVRQTAVIKNGEVRMADLSIIGSHSVNGVAALHSDILKNSLFHAFYIMNPEKFNNKTNGISHRRFLIQSNPALSSLITEAIGESWKTDFNQIEKLLDFKDDPAFLEKLGKCKRENKLRFADYVSRTQHIILDPDSLFDVQVKRIHAYKRQLLNAFKVLELYNEIKLDPFGHNVHPCTFIFSGKAAPGYAFAKEVIKFICSVADLVNSDPVASRIIKLVFIENFCVSNAQIIYPSADISEQISTAGKEASGTGNMKFMMNGAVTLGTLDGANVEIRNLVGDDNMVIFGLNAPEVENYYKFGGYSAQKMAAEDSRIAYMLQQLVDDTFAKSGQAFWGIRDAMIQQNDEYFVLKDFDSYMNAYRRVCSMYDETESWNRMALVNVAKSAYFSSDRTIREYVRDIWHTACK